MKAASILRAASSFVSRETLDKTVDDFVPWEDVAKFEGGLKRGSALQRVVYWGRTKIEPNGIAGPVRPRRRVIRKELAPPCTTRRIGDEANAHQCKAQNYCINRIVVESNYTTCNERTEILPLSTADVYSLVCYRSTVIPCRAIAESSNTNIAKLNTASSSKIVWMMYFFRRDSDQLEHSIHY